MWGAGKRKSRRPARFVDYYTEGLDEQQRDDVRPRSTSTPRFPVPKPREARREVDVDEVEEEIREATREIEALKVDLQRMERSVLEVQEGQQQNGEQKTRHSRDVTAAKSRENSPTLGRHLGDGRREPPTRISANELRQFTRMKQDLHTRATSSPPPSRGRSKKAAASARSSSSSSESSTSRSSSSDHSRASRDADFQWKLLEEDTRTTQASVFAVGTSRNHQTHISTYLNFCNYFGIVPMPANPHNLACYAQFLSRSLRSSDSIAHYLSSVKLFHHLNGFTTFSLDHFEIAHTMKGLKKRLQHRPRQHGRVDIPLLVDLAGCFNTQVPRDAAIWAAIVFSFFTFFRRSNVVLDSKTQFDPKKHLKRRDILVSPAGLLIYVTWTKTLQSRERVLSVPLLPIPGSPICPVAAYTHMCDLIPTEPDQPAFVVPYEGS
ncbi:PREDICTED: uncharacterized protein LOC109470089 [Branchiostoma belcheri]|uniref:Uncharacterized protein LOC109470089 n=1 Tax=Branchiostoma belcheri TaxID=7741 RepID=A0A6P4Z022_BRABE|nr:PREDICTED: uncharacterized protein LOC109470089 [Branchiostoma belcheri]